MNMKMREKIHTELCCTRLPSTMTLDHDVKKKPSINNNKLYKILFQIIF